MDGEDWSGLAVRTRDGTMLGVVVGVFAQGPLAGWLRVQGDATALGSKRGSGASLPYFPDRSGGKFALFS
jgi:hypothetical protein